MTSSVVLWTPCFALDSVHSILSCSLVKLSSLLQYDDWNASGYQLDEARQAAKASMDSQSPEEWVDRFGNEPRKGADIVVQCLEREGAHRVFAYPGGASMEIHQALTRSNLVKNTLCRHEQVCSWLAQAVILYFEDSSFSAWVLEEAAGPE